MAANRPSAPDEAYRIETLISARVAERAPQWFPDQPRSVKAVVRTLSHRPTCTLYAVHLGDATSRPRLLAKVRRDGHAPARATGPRPGGRPRLRAEPLGARELTALEFDGLSRIRAAFDASDPRFGTVRPLDHLPAEATILMEFVDSATLRQRLIGESRLVRYATVRGRPPASDETWANVGRWLSVYQSSGSTQERPARQGTRAEIVDQFHAYDEFLATRLGRPHIADIATGGAQAAADVFPEQLPLAVGHGDYAPRNMFVTSDGRLVVFDPMPRWAVPELEDLCRFLVGTRLLGLQLHTRGAAFSRDQLDRYERQVISGYLDGAGPTAPLRCYQLLLLLDKWSALVETTTGGGGWQSRLRATSLSLANSYLRAEARRLLELTRSS
jgi:hypothetical protein